MKKPGLVIALVFTIACSALHGQMRIAVVSNAADRKELRAIDSMFRGVPDLAVEIIPISSINPASLRRFRFLWFHRTDTTAFSRAELNLAPVIKTFVSNGGGLYLSMEAVPLLNKWGIESSRFSTQTDTLKDEGFGRPAGYHGFKTHPLFTGLSGGVYVSKQKKDHIVRKHGFFGDARPVEGSVAGIQWTYLTFTESSKLLLEYNLGKGKVIAAGAYQYFSADNYNAAHLRRFTLNVFRYLAGELKGATLHWTYDDRTISTKNFNLPPVPPMQSGKWQLPAPTLRLETSKPGADFYDLVGRRMLWMGKLQGGMDEVWIHPFMSLRDFQAGVKLRDSDSISWLQHKPSKVIVTPEYLVREYEFPSSTLREIFTVSFEHPAGVAHYEVEGEGLDSLVLTHASSMRYMWPYSHHATGSILYSFNDNINGHVIEAQSGKLATLVVYSNKPSAHHAQTDTGRNEAQFRTSFAAGNNMVLNVSIIGSESGIDSALKIYRDNQASMNRLYQRSGEYYDALLKNHLHFITPDSLFNEGYKWALARSDQFLQTTPGIGTGLMAGFGTTARGWNGRHKISGRPGYAWYFGRDGQWSAMAINAYGDFKMVKETLESFVRFQDVRGKIFHELSSSGVAHYDAADATPLFVVLAAHYLKYSGDTAFIRSIWPSVVHAMEFNYSTDTDGDGLIENTNVGHGWIEGGRLFGTHTEFYLAGAWAACLESAAYLARSISKEGSAKYERDAQKVRDIIDNDFWNERMRFFHNGKLIDGSFMPDATVLAAVPIYLGVVKDEAKATAVAARFSGNRFSSDWGIRMIEDSSRNYHPGSYHGGMVWPLYGGWASLAEFQTGYFNSGFQHIMNNLLVYRHWGLGSIEETLNGNIYKPNGVTSHQCWSQTMVVQPAIEGMLGLRPDAISGKLSLSPFFPWNWSHAQVKNIRMSNTLVHLGMQRSGDTTSFSIESNNAIKLHFSPAFPPGSEIKLVQFNGRTITNPVIQQLPGGIRVSVEVSLLNGNNTLAIVSTGGVGVLPVIALPAPGDSSASVKIISEEFVDQRYVFTAEARPASAHEVTVFSKIAPKEIRGATIVHHNGELYRLRLQIPSGSEKYAIQKVELEF